ncbi:CCA tRNA nucleotidyltransferase [Streptococcus thoraltensis]|uniref:CCA tRNA nucleotidyltransferase n=1 Tax=Streptococcus thoraltensis TaxID=55085 RepID=UPI0003617F18|nr:CCA tRNA nucleotidyltransferase [Streptococcus thoraltensis]MDY4761060.1 CCA tRNA nucleotidyltransferase [Streptococcus thoraltensis]
MKLEKLPIEFEEALPLLEKIKKAGFEAYFVGGSVRDVLLGRPIHDVDIATSSYPEETKAIFERTVDVGIEHGTVLVLENGHEYEMTTFRTEDVYVDYRRPSSVSFVRSLKEDLKRRDFTVNAFALNEDREVIDLFDGLKDLKNRVLRAVGIASERFNEDALRIMRGIRFSASLDFDIEEQTLAAMSECAPLLEKISVERSFIEFDKLLLAPHWSKGLDALIATGAYDYLPDFQGTATKWRAFQRLIEKDYQFLSSEQAWAAVMIVLAIHQPKGFLKKWKTSIQFQKRVTQMIEVFQARKSSSLTSWQVYQYGKELIQEVEALRAAFGMEADFDGLAQLDKDLLIHDKHDIVVNGGILISELNMKPGPDLGEMLSQVELAIVKGELSNDKEAIFDFVKDKI